jgi:hypothetical protein
MFRLCYVSDRRPQSAAGPTPGPITAGAAIVEPKPRPRLVVGENPRPIAGSAMDAARKMDDEEDRANGGTPHAARRRSARAPTMTFA